jgi:hypothetical protein
VIAAERWGEISAAYYHPGHNLLREKPYLLLSLVYTWCLERIAPDKIEEWLEDLRELLPWQDSSSAAAEALESESFFAMQGTAQK